MDNLKNSLVIFTTSPAGLGHIRVMNSIEEGKPSNIDAVSIGLTNIRINRVHDLGSRVPAFVNFTEFYQTNPLAERIVTRLYVRFLRRHIGATLKEFRDIRLKYPEKKVWIIVSTHFALAHSISSAKEKLENDFGVKIHHFVVVTDDSAQRIWLVKNADITFVPSDETREKLALFLPPDKASTLKTIPFPISPKLIQNLSPDEFKFIVDEAKSDSGISTQIEIPISGAAVQLDFFNKIITSLTQDDFEFSVVGQESLLTMAFFESMSKIPRVQVSIGADATQTVEYYESVFFQAKRPLIEITKPSEQAFKSLLTPNERGGLLLLLTPPIGRQERDNLLFLVRNGLMPEEAENKALFQDEDLSGWQEKAKSWRAISLPPDPVQAVAFIKKLKVSKIFEVMLSCVPVKKDNINTNGVAKIWEEIEKLIK